MKWALAWKIASKDFRRLWHISLKSERWMLEKHVETLKENAELKAELEAVKAEMDTARYIKG